MSQGFIPAENPCCGIHAVAEAACLPFQSVWNIAKFTVQKKASWRGRTVYSERLKVLENLGAEFFTQYDLTGLSLIEAAYIAFERGGNYIFDIPGHSLAFKNGRLIDQCGEYHPTKYQRRFHRIDHATRVNPVTGFDEEKLWETLVDPLAL